MSFDSSLLDTPLDMRYCRGLSDKVALFNRQADSHKESQARNPFSGSGSTPTPTPRLDKRDAEYGRPVSGSKTDIRGKRAHTHITKEILELCQIIHEHGETVSMGGDTRVVISFGELFQIYTYISNKVVGLLLRARKQKLIDFEGETLFQRRDDDVPVVLCKPIQEIQAHFRELQEEQESADP